MKQQTRQSSQLSLQPVGKQLRQLIEGYPCNVRALAGPGGGEAFTRMKKSELAQSLAVSHRDDRRLFSFDDNFDCPHLYGDDRVRDLIGVVNRLYNRREPYAVRGPNAIGPRSNRAGLGVLLGFASGLTPETLYLDNRRVDLKRRGETMPVEIIDASGKLLQAKVWALMRKDDYDRIVRTAKEAIAREGRIRALIFLEAFAGWERRADWGDVSFITEHSKDIEKIAIVGDEKWKDDAFAFTGRGFRSSAIEFFSRVDEAREWLSS